MAKNRSTEASVGLLSACEDELRAQLAVISARRAKLGARKSKAPMFDRDMAMATAALSRALVSSEGERRQQGKALIREVSLIPIDQIVAFLKTLPEIERVDISRRVLGTDDEAPLL